MPLGYIGVWIARTRPDGSRRRRSKSMLFLSFSAIAFAYNNHHMLFTYLYPLNGSAYN